MRVLRFTVVLASCVSLAGCLQATTVIKVNADGSGTLEQTTLMSAAALAQLRQLAGGLGGQKNGKPVEPFSEEQERAQAQKIPGVTFVSSTPVHSAEGEGRRTVYAFTDITQVKVNERPHAPGGVSMRSDAVNTNDVEPISFSLTETASGDSLLTVHFPEPKIPPPSERPADARTPPTPEQLAMAKQMFGGMKIAIALELNGRVVRTSSPYAQGNRVTLFEMDFDRLMKDETLLPRLQASKSVEEAKQILKEVPGMKINPGREVTVEFASR